MTKQPLTSGLNGCIIKSEEPEAAFSFLERLEYPGLLPPPVHQYFIGAADEEKRRTLTSCALTQEESVGLLTSILLGLVGSEVAELKTVSGDVCTPR